jgi:hypothetical protein
VYRLDGFTIDQHGAQMPSIKGLRAASTGFLAVLTLSVPSASAGESSPFQRTTSAIMASPAAESSTPAPRPAVRLAAPRRKLAIRPDSPRSSASPEGASAALRSVDAPSQPQTPGVNFLGATLADSNAFPPDSTGAAGPTQFLVGVNGRLRSFSKATGAADGVLNATLDAFFGTVRNNNPTFFPQVRYDRISSRWIVTSNAAGDSLVNNRVLIAVTDAASNGVLSGATVWTFFYFQHNLVTSAGDTDLFFDSPSLGVGVNGLTIGGNLFNAQGAYQGTSVHVVRKSRVLSSTGGNLVSSGDVVAFRNLTTTVGGPGPYAPVGVDDLSDAAAATSVESWIAGVDNASFGALVFRRITFASPGAWPPSGISANMLLSVPATSLPVTVPHEGNLLGVDGELDAVDDRLTAASRRGDRIWTAQNISVDTSGVSPGDRDGSRWYEIDVSAAPALTQAGTLFDPSPTDASSYWIPAIAASGQGHAAIGSSVSGPLHFIDAGTAGRLAGDPPGTLQPQILLTSSATSYNPAADPGPGRRWGGHSFTSVDPNDDMTMWTIQEYCDATDSWGVRVVELVAPPPATPQTASPSSISAGQASVSVDITGVSTDGSGFFDPGAGFPGRLQVAVNGGVTVNSVTFTDPTSITLDLDTTGAGAGGVAVTITNPDGQSVGTGCGFLNIGAPGPAPTVTAISPTSGPASGGTAATLTGTGFLCNPTIAIGGFLATNVLANSGTSASLTMPATTPGVVHDVVLTNGDAQSGTLVGGWFSDFLDVPQGDIFHESVEKLIRNGVTVGCGGGNYCRNDSVTRAQMAVLLLRSKLGIGYVPPNCTGTVFNDVQCTGGSFDPWIEDLAARGITGGCSVSPPLYCPSSPVTRAQMSAFLLKTDLGSGYQPPDCTGSVFDDVPCTGGIFDPWIEDLAGRGITAGCSVSPPLYCPDVANTRGQMAAFLVNTFQLP